MIVAGNSLSDLSQASATADELDQARQQRVLDNAYRQERFNRLSAADQEQARQFDTTNNRLAQAMNQQYDLGLSPWTRGMTPGQSAELGLRRDMAMMPYQGMTKAEEAQAQLSGRALENQHEANANQLKAALMQYEQMTPYQQAQLKLATRQLDTQERMGMLGALASASGGGSPEMQAFNWQNQQGLNDKASAANAELQSARRGWYNPGRWFGDRYDPEAVNAAARKYAPYGVRLNSDPMNPDASQFVSPPARPNNNLVLEYLKEAWPEQAGLINRIQARAGGNTGGAQNNLSGAAGAGSNPGVKLDLLNGPGAGEFNRFIQQRGPVPADTGAPTWELK